MTIRTFIVVLAVCAAGSALASSLPSFKTVDTNGDGKISQTEAAAVEGLDFAAADKNGDGMLDRSEYEAVGKTG